MSQKKKFKVENFAKKCQHTTQFIFSKKQITELFFKKFKKFQPIMVLQSMPLKKKLFSKFLEGNANIPSNFFFHFILFIK
jgi:hypothetical protein